jgi:phosphohistidine phosphatase SixA
MRVLVRHADAGNKRAWTGLDAERPLSQEGREQAGGLVGLLAGLRLERLLTSPLLRCTQTLEPLAAALALDLEPVEELSVEADAARMAALLEDPGTEHAVLCTHGEALQTLFAQLRDEAKLRDSVEPPFQKGSAWVLERSGDRFRSRYLAPRSPGQGGT